MSSKREKSDTVSIDALTERISQIEDIIGHEGHRFPSASLFFPLKQETKETKSETKFDDVKIPHVTGELQELSLKWKKVEDKSLQAFFKKYGELSSILDNEIEMKSLLLTRDMKEQIVVAAIKDLTKTAKDMEALKSVTSVIDKNIVPNLPQLQSRLIQNELRVENYSNQVSSLHSDVEAFVDNYNDFVTVMSRRFLFLNDQLAKWETALDAALAGK